MKKTCLSLVFLFVVSISSVANAASYSCYVKYIDWKNGDSQTTTHGYLSSVKASSRSDAEYKAMRKMADIKDLPMSRMSSAKCS